MTSAPQALTKPTGEQNSSTSVDPPLRGHLERWFPDATLWIGMGEAGGCISLTPIEQGDDGLPHHRRKAEVKATITLPQLIQLHAAVGDLLEYFQGADRDTAEVAIKLPPDGSKKVYVNKRTAPPTANEQN